MTESSLISMFTNLLRVQNNIFFEREREFRAFLKQNDWFRFTHSFSNSSSSLHAVSVLSVTHRFTDSIELFMTESSLVTLLLKSHVKL